jgi:hypothetical protein
MGRSKGSTMGAAWEEEEVPVVVREVRMRRKGRGTEGRS